MMIMLTNQSKQGIVLLLLGFLVVALALTSCVGLAPMMSHQGRLLDAAGNPVPDGDYEVVYSIYNAETAGNMLHTETQTVTIEDGLFTTSLGLTAPMDPLDFAEPTWLEVTVDGEVLTPRQRLQGAPFAFSLSRGAVVTGPVTIDREYLGQADTGAGLTVVNTDSTATGGHGLLVINNAAAPLADREKVAALQARAVGGNFSNGTGGYGAIITSENYRGLYVQSHPNWLSALFDGLGIQVDGALGCVGCRMSYFGQNSGAAAISPGDLVAVDNVVSDPDLGIPIMQVRKATSPADAIVGVAVAAAQRDPVGEYNGVTTGGFNPIAGPAARNDYVVIVVQGLVQARAADASLQPGVAIVAGADGVVADAVADAAAAGTSFRAFSPVDADGMVWLMVGGQ